MNLTAFLKDNAIKFENVKFAASSRFIDEKGKPMLWEIRCLSTEENSKLRERFTKKIIKNGKTKIDFDTTGYLNAMAAKSTVFPDLNSKELQDSYGVMGDEALLKQLLCYAGEYDAYLLEIQNVNQFSAVDNDDIEEAKN